MNCEQRMGVSVIASSSESATAVEMVMPNWKRKTPTKPPTSTTGMKTAMTATVAAVAAKVISRAPSSAACRADLPMWKWRVMFSSTMIESSTTMPMASDRPSSVKKFSVKPR